MKGKGLVIPRDPANIKALFGAATCSRASWMKLFHVEGVTVKGVLAQCWLGLGNIQVGGVILFLEAS